MPHLNGCGEGEDSQRPGQHRGHALAQNQDLPLGEPVSHHPTPGSQQQGRQELQCHRDAHSCDGTGQFQHHPILGNPLHPECDHGNEVAGGENPEVGHFQGDERVPPRKVFGQNRERLGAGRRICGVDDGLGDGCR
jgi:hypothetical protein